MSSIKFILGEKYRVYRADGTTIDFKVLDLTVEVIPTGEKLTIQEVLGTYTDVIKLDK